jgi:hypothetical protein
MPTYLYNPRTRTYRIERDERPSDDERVSVKVADLVVGTNESEVLKGHEGGIFDDQIWGGEGDDTMYGGGGNDTIKPGYPSKDYLADWGVDEAHGGAGEDLLDFGNNTNTTYLFGDSGNDTLIGGCYTDHMKGGDDHDQLFGMGGNDRLEGGEGSDNLFGDVGGDLLFGGAGFDWLEGGFGLDILDGGADKDWLTGHWDPDIFRFGMTNGVSDTKVDNPDELLDFWSNEDWVDLPMSGTEKNYTEMMIGYGAGYDIAKGFADTLIGTDTGFRYAYIADGIDGFLFGDFDGTGTVDSGIIIDWNVSLSDFDYTHII